MKYATIRIEGSILSPDILDRIDQGDLGGQSIKEFGLDGKTKVKDEIIKAWADAQDMWRIFSRQRERLKESDYGTTETRKYWVVPLLGLLGYNAEYSSKGETVNERNYAISHRAINIDNFPIHVMGINDSLDMKRQDSGPRMSPHGLIQEYLNLTEHLYALVTNGKYLRLLRDSSRLIKLSFLEFDLERMMEDQSFADFAIMFRLLHVSRMPQKMDQGPESLIEKYHQDSLEAGSRIRDGLSNAIKYAIEKLSIGFLQNPNNQTLLDQVSNQQIASQQFYQNMLRLIYRLLFLMVIEERDLIYPKEADKKKRSIYYNFYSINRLRTLCDKRYLADKAYNDAWLSAKNTFKLFESEEYGQPLGIKPLAGDLFSEGAIGLLSECDLSNEVFLTCLLQLSVFTHPKTKQKMRINYRALNVEEFGSVYEGLLEFSPELVLFDGKYKLVFKEGDERSSSGSHYTPDELVQPLIKHSLDYIIEDKLKEKSKEKALLSITVCDVACGSGHILLNAARRIALELAKIRTGEDQPAPEAMRFAIRDVIRSCIYGVDKNELAVELCKVSLWLEGHIPGEPLGFLDHRIKCGDAIVGLAHEKDLKRGIPDEAFKANPGDDKEFRSALAKINKSERKENKAQMKIDPEILNAIHGLKNIYDELYKMPEKTPKEIKKKKEAFLSTSESKNVYRLRTLAHCQVAQFFIPKVVDNKAKIMTHVEYMDLLEGKKPLQGQNIAYAQAEGFKRKFFHWFLEFPEIMEKGGFDCILGNPPYLGDKKLKKAFGSTFLNYVKSEYSVGINDLVVYFFNRIYCLLKNNAFEALITTSSISQGDLRIGGLDRIQKKGGEIVFAIKSVRWPGVASLNVAIVSIIKGRERDGKWLNNKKVNFISSFLTEEVDIGEPFVIKINQNKVFTGYYFLGDGFLLANEEAKKIIKRDIKYKDVIFPLINGSDLNDSYNQANSRCIINFFDWPLDADYDSQSHKPQGPPYAADYPACLQIVENLVKPYRQRWKVDKNGAEVVGEYALRKPLPERWWIYGESRPGMRRAIHDLNYVFVTAQTTKYLNFIKVSTKNAISQTAYVLASEQWSDFTVLQSSLHFEWSVKYGNSKGHTFRYAPSKCFETFPFPSSHNHSNMTELGRCGESFYSFRQDLMSNIMLGLTKLYNQFHNGQLSKVMNELSPKIIEKELGREAKYLWRHLEKINKTSSFNEIVENIFRLRELYKEVDFAVLKAYGWNDIDLAHNFYEVDYLPENDRVRFTISPEARKEILRRLLELNHQIHEKEEEEAALQKPKRKKKKIEEDVTQKTLF